MRRFLRWLRILSCCSLACGASACAQLKWLATPFSAESPQSAVVLGPPVERFIAGGRLALRQGERRDHVRFEWRHTPHGDNVLLMTPLGSGLAELTRDAHGASLIQPNRPTVSASSLSELTQQALGMSLPLESLSDWMRGASNRLTAEIDGWRVEVTQTQSLAIAAQPHRLVRILQAQQAEMELKLVVDEWTFDESPTDAGP